MASRWSNKLQKSVVSELGERFAREEMERDERMEMLIEDLGLEGPALEEYLRVHRQVEMELMMDELRGEEQFSSPAAQRTLDEIEKHVKNGPRLPFAAAIRTPPPATSYFSRKSPKK